MTVSGGDKVLANDGDAFSKVLVNDGVSRATNC